MNNSLPETLPLQPMQMLRDAMCSVWRHRRLATVIFTMITLGAIVGAYAQSPKYESSARLLIKLDRKNLSSVADVRYQVAQVMAEEAIASQAEILRANELVAGVVQTVGVDVLKKSPSKNPVLRFVSARVAEITGGLKSGLAALGLAESLPPEAETVKQIQKDLRVYPVRKTHVIEVTFRAKKREAPPLVLSALIDQYMKKVASLNLASQQYMYYQRQTEQQREILAEAETHLAKFKVKHGVVDLATERQMLQREIEDLRLVFNATYGGLPSANNVRGITTGSNEPPQLTTRLNELYLERAKRAITYQPDHPRVEEINSQIAKAETLLNQQSQRIGSLIERYKTRLNTLGTIEPELKQLQRQTKLSEDTYEIYRKAASDRRLAEEQEGRVTIQVIDAPSYPREPLSPSRLTILIAGIGLALVLALAASILAGRMDARRASSARQREHAAQMTPMLTTTDGHSTIGKSV